MTATRIAVLVTDTAGVARAVALAPDHVPLVASQTLARITAQVEVEAAVAPRNTGVDTEAEADPPAGSTSLSHEAINMTIIVAIPSTARISTRAGIATITTNTTAAAKSPARGEETRTHPVQVLNADTRRETDAHDLRTTDPAARKPKSIPTDIVIEAVRGIDIRARTCRLSVNIAYTCV